MSYFPDGSVSIHHSPSGMHSSSTRPGLTRRASSNSAADSVSELAAGLRANSSHSSTDSHSSPEPSTDPISSIAVATNGNIAILNSATLTVWSDTGAGLVPAAVWTNESIVAGGGGSRRRSSGATTTAAVSPGSALIGAVWAPNSSLIVVRSAAHVLRFFSVTSPPGADSLLAPTLIAPDGAPLVHGDGTLATPMNPVSGPTSPMPSSGARMPWSSAGPGMAAPSATRQYAHLLAGSKTSSRVLSLNLRNKTKLFHSVHGIAAMLPLKSHLLVVTRGAAVLAFRWNGDHAYSCVLPGAPPLPPTLHPEYPPEVEAFVPPPYPSHVNPVIVPSMEKSGKEVTSSDRSLILGAASAKRSSVLAILPASGPPSLLVFSDSGLAGTDVFSPLAVHPLTYGSSLGAPTLVTVSSQARTVAVGTFSGATALFRLPPPSADLTVSTPIPGPVIHPVLEDGEKATPVCSIAWSPDGGSLAIAWRSGHTAIHASGSGLQLSPFSTSSSRQPSSNDQASSRPTHSLVWSWSSWTLYGGPWHESPDCFWSLPLRRMSSSPRSSSGPRASLPLAHVGPYSVSIPSSVSHRSGRLAWIRSAAPDDHTGGAWKAGLPSPDGRYVALAGRRGFLILDTRTKRWKRFNDTISESLFSVDTMVWIACDLLAVSSVAADTGAASLQLFSTSAPLALPARVSVSTPRRIISMASSVDTLLATVTAEPVLQLWSVSKAQITPMFGFPLDGPPPSSLILHTPTTRGKSAVVNSGRVIMLRSGGLLSSLLFDGDGNAEPEEQIAHDIDSVWLGEGSLPTLWASGSKGVSLCIPVTPRGPITLTPVQKLPPETTAIGVAPGLGALVASHVSDSFTATGSNITASPILHHELSLLLQSPQASMALGRALNSISGTLSARARKQLLGDALERAQFTKAVRLLSMHTASQMSLIAKNAQVPSKSRGPERIISVWTQEAFDRGNRRMSLRPGLRDVGWYRGYPLLTSLEQRREKRIIDRERRAEREAWEAEHPSEAGSDSEGSVSSRNSPFRPDPSTTTPAPDPMAKAKLAVGYLKAVHGLIEAVEPVPAVIYIAVARTLDSSVWPVLWALTGPPSKLVDDAANSGDLNTACAGLLLVHEEAGPVASSRTGLSLLERALTEENWVLCRGLLRFMGVSPENLSSRLEDDKAGHTPSLMGGAENDIVEAEVVGLAAIVISRAVRKLAERYALRSIAALGAAIHVAPGVLLGRETGRALNLQSPADFHDACDMIIDDYAFQPGAVDADALVFDAEDDDDLGFGDEEVGDNGDRDGLEGLAAAHRRGPQGLFAMYGEARDAKATRLAALIALLLERPDDATVLLKPLSDRVQVACLDAVSGIESLAHVWNVVSQDLGLLDEVESSDDDDDDDVQLGRPGNDVNNSTSDD